MIYYNGVEVSSGTTKSGGSRHSGDGRIAVGRRYTNWDQDYASAQVDELIIFDHSLSTGEVQSIYNAA